MSFLAGLNLAIALMVGLLLLDWVRDRLRVRRFVASLGNFPEPPLARALELAVRIANRPRAECDPVYLSNFLRSFGATGHAVVRHGGCCSGTSRLYMLSLEVLGIRANQITVYHRRGHAQHCLVEVHLPDGPAIIDPVYAVYYVDPAGNPVGLDALQAGAEVRYAEIEGALDPGYPDDDYYDFDLPQTKTANWTLSRPRRLTYSILRVFSRGAVDRMRVPQTLESPQTLLALVLAGAGAVASGVTLVSRWIASI